MAGRTGVSTLTPQLLLRAYANGVFPMAESQDDPEIFWVDPALRGIFDLNSFHISRSLARRLRGCGWDVAVDRDFNATVGGCAAREVTWINETIFDLYAQLHEMGHAHSLELWEGAELIGGVYGVAIGGAFFGESMFSRRRDASKVALAHLVDRLRLGGFTLFDTQFLTPHLASLGAIEIPRDVYHKHLERALLTQADFHHLRGPASAQEVLHRNSQTS